uniref:Thrombospondin type 1 domain containing 4 n=1 Tax=Gadus morhua TaxID=8049 RepID=A0A8C5AW06_GADMO
MLLCIPSPSEPPQEAVAVVAAAGGHGVAQGSWGAWGAPAPCSRTCGRGVQEQSRPCLPVYAAPPLRPAPDPRRPGGGGGSGGGRVQDSRYVVSLTPPCVPRTGLFSPGQYGYGRVRAGALPAAETGPRLGGSPSQRYRRSPPSQSFQPPPPRPHGGHRPQHQHQHNLPGRTYPGPRGPRPKAPPVWAPLYQPGSAYLQPGRGPQSSGSQGPPERPYEPLDASACTGENSRFRICNNKACPSSSPSIRAAQCSSYNRQAFMGRLYDWEPFSEVPGEQGCELNCRALGFRFYVRLSDRVTDGAPCGGNGTALCVAGKCLSPGCDDFVGPGRVVDKCGVCGGDNTACRLVSGLFQHSLTRVGYHKILEIPQGATKINVTEMVKSKNYLALRNRAGRSIINGNWAIDRPGRYEGGGTMFTYRRPNEITSTAGESFLADGPTNQILDVFMIYQQPNPGVHYEYILPSESPANPTHPDHSPDGNTVNGQGGYNHHGNTHQEGYDPAGGGRPPSSIPDNQVPAVQPPRSQREYNWRQAGTTECSASCGKGYMYAIFHCVHRLNHEEVSDALCDSSTKPSQQEEPCNTQHCPAFWDIGEWSECSKTCGLGMQHRQVLCRQVYANRTLNVHTGRCRHLERPETASTCQLKICSEWQIRTEWTVCSVPCGLGQRSRDVQCVSNIGDLVPDEECNMNLQPSAVENCDMGACAKSWFYTHWGATCSAECGMGVRTRGVLCLTNQISSLPLEGCGHERPADSQVCNNGPCESSIEWFTGPWSQCSAECGVGSQQRAVVCLVRAEEGYAAAPPYECSSLDRPLGQQSCNLGPCGAKWYHTDWSACSKSCEEGFRLREVRCLADSMQPSDGCQEQDRPPEREPCNPEPCTPDIDEKCRDKYFNCNVVVQARLCVYDYYRTTCCASCTRVAHRHSAPRGHS